MKKTIESTIRWRGSITDLATDVAYLLTPEEGLRLAEQLKEFAESPRLSTEKYRGKGYEKVQ